MRADQIEQKILELIDLAESGQATRSDLQGMATALAYRIADEPLPGVQYALTGKPDSKCIANGNTWAESEVNNPIDDVDLTELERMSQELRNI